MAIVAASALAGAVALAISAETRAQSEVLPSQEQDKCYGIATAGKNDCKATSHVCAGWSKMDSDPASFILLPAGTCEKIVGGSLKPKS